MRAPCQSRQGYAGAMNGPPALPTLQDLQLARSRAGHRGFVGGLLAGLAVGALTVGVVMVACPPDPVPAAQPAPPKSPPVAAPSPSPSLMPAQPVDAKTPGVSP